jgi:hypothetical protein
MPLVRVVVSNLTMRSKNNLRLTGTKKSNHHNP